MKHSKSFIALLVLFLTNAGVAVAASDSDWTCYARDSIGNQYPGVSELKSEASELAIRKCRREANPLFANCHQLFGGECVPPSEPQVWSCYARDSIGNRYAGRSEDKDEAISLAKSRCRRDANPMLANCHTLPGAECGRD